MNNHDWKQWDGPAAGYEAMNKNHFMHDQLVLYLSADFVQFN